MPRYFFRTNGDDDDGTELPDDIAAREQARETFGTMIRDGSVGDAAQMKVVDAIGRHVLMLRFSTER